MGANVTRKWALVPSFPVADNQDAMCYEVVNSPLYLCKLQSYSPLSKKTGALMLDALR